MPPQADMPLILIAEDDADISTIMTRYLDNHGLSCMQAFSGTEAVMDLDRSAFDLLICDLMLPGMTGEQVIANAREHIPDIPVIVVSARATVEDRVGLLRLGADDYLVKPFDLEELELRVRALLRRSRRQGSAGGRPQEGDGDVLRVGAWALDVASRVLTAADQHIELTRTEFGICELLARHPRRAYSKREIFERVWHEDFAPDDNAVTVHVSNLRKKLRPTGTDGYIKTVWGIGFKLDAPTL